MLVSIKHKMQSNNEENVQAETKVETPFQESVEVKASDVEIQAETKVETQPQVEISVEEEIVGKIIKMIGDGEGQGEKKIKSVVEIISSVMEIIEQKRVEEKLKTALAILEKISISSEGENHDLIKKLRVMVESGLVEGIIEGLISASKGLYQIQKIVNKDTGCKCVVM